MPVKKRGSYEIPQINMSVEGEIVKYTASSILNHQKTSKGRYFSKPLIGFADASDPLFERYKNIIGDFHLTPKEFFEAEFGVDSFNGGTVICWVLPINKNVLMCNRTQTKFPSIEWAHARYYGEAFNDALRSHMISFLTDMGYRSVSPSLSSKWKRIYSPPVGHASSWSERHAAYAAGLGTFSLSDGLITEKGIAHRCGSVVTELKLKSTTRPYEGAYDYCLFYSSNACGLCIKRCPAGAITSGGHNKDLCFKFIREVVVPAVNEGYAVTTPSCGLCQTKIPCETKMPVKKRK
jgi:epoxyqueuosine reductase